MEISSHLFHLLLFRYLITNRGINRKTQRNDGIRSWYRTFFICVEIDVMISMFCVPWASDELKEREREIILLRLVLSSRCFLLLSFSITFLWKAKRYGVTDLHHIFLSDNRNFLLLLKFLSVSCLWASLLSTKDVFAWNSRFLLSCSMSWGCGKFWC